MDTPSAPIRWRLEVLRALLVGLVPITMGLGFLLTCDWFDLAEDDGQSIVQPLFTDFLRQLQSGRLPLWSHHTGCGFPLFARSGGLYPGHYLSHAICQLVGWEAEEIAVSHLWHLGFAAFAAYLFLIYFGVRPLLATSAAIAYGYTGPLLGLATNWNDYCYWMPYAPLSFLLIERINGGDRSWLWPCLLGFFAACVYHASGLVGGVKFTLLLGGYYLLRMERKHLLTSLLRFGVAGLLAFLASAGQFLATREYLSLTTRLPNQGVDLTDSLVVNAVRPEFYRGFFYPWVQFLWEGGFNAHPTPDGISRFQGEAVFAGPLAPLGLCLALLFVRGQRGVERALLILLGVYFLLSLGYYFEGNFWVAQLPFFRHYRWPIRWTPEFCGLGALLGGLALERALREPRDRKVLIGLLVFLGLTVFAVVIRPGSTTDRERGLLTFALLWLALSGALAYFLYKEQRGAFGVLALFWTVASLLLCTPGMQRHRWAELRHLRNEPLAIQADSPGRILYLANEREQRLPRTEGGLAYCLPHQLGGRTVLTYGPWSLKGQEWQAGISPKGELVDEEAAAEIFFGGNLLETLRVGHVVIARDNPRLKQACDDNPNLRFAQETASRRIYRHIGFQAPAYFVRQVLPRTLVKSPRDLSKMVLSRVCQIDDDSSGHPSFSGEGQVSDFAEDHGTITLTTQANEEQFLVVTTTWYPGWQATLDGQEAQLFRVNGSFMGVRVPAGAHQVRLSYSPPWLVGWFALNAAMLAGLAIGCGASLIRFLLRKGEPGA